MAPDEGWEAGVSRGSLGLCPRSSQANSLGRCATDASCATKGSQTTRPEQPDVRTRDETISYQLDAHLDCLRHAAHRQWSRESIPNSSSGSSGAAARRATRQTTERTAGPASVNIPRPSSRYRRAARRFLRFTRRSAYHAVQMPPRNETSASNTDGKGSHDSAGRKLVACASVP
jgi:hypothetical protein